MMKINKILVVVIISGLFAIFGIWVASANSTDAPPFQVRLPLIFRPEPILESIGPEGGSTVILVSHPAHPDKIFAGTWGGGIFISTDGGQSWYASSEGLFNYYINSLTIDPQNPDILYAGTYRDGVFKSVDGGRTWAVTGPGLNEEPVVYTVAVDPQDSNIVYAGTRHWGVPAFPWGGGVYKSVNGGQTWEERNTKLGEDWVYSIAVDPQSPVRVYAATHSKGVYRSDNRGESWYAINNGLLDYSTRSLVIDPQNPLNISVGTWHSYYAFATNNADTWHPIGSGLGSKVYALTMDQTSPSTLYAATLNGGVKKTINSGAQWGQAGFPSFFVYTVHVNSSQPEELLAGLSRHGVFGSSDGGVNWGKSDSGLSVTEITGLVVNPSNPSQIFAAAYGSGFFEKTPSGWLTRNDTGLMDYDLRSLALIPGSTPTLYLGSDTHGVYKSSDGGQNWKQVNNGLAFGLFASSEQSKDSVSINTWGQPDFYDSAYWSEWPQDGPSTLTQAILTFGVDPNSADTIYLGVNGSGVYKTANGGYSWAYSGLDGLAIPAVVPDPFVPGLVYAAGGDTQQTYGAFHRSDDAGVTWQPSSTGLPGSMNYSMAADLHQPGQLYMGTGNGVYRSTDSGLTWQPSGLITQTVMAIAASPVITDVVYAGTNEGLWISEDGGLSWRDFNEGLHCPEILNFALSPTLPEVNYIGTKAGGVFRYAP